MYKNFQDWLSAENQRKLMWSRYCTCNHRERFHMWNKSDHPRSSK